MAICFFASLPSFGEGDERLVEKCFRHSGIRQIVLGVVSSVDQTIWSHRILEVLGQHLTSTVLLWKTMPDKYLPVWARWRAACLLACPQLQRPTKHEPYIVMKFNSKLPGLTLGRTIWSQWPCHYGQSAPNLASYNSFKTLRLVFVELLKFSLPCWLKSPPVDWGMT